MPAARSLAAALLVIALGCSDGDDAAPPATATTAPATTEQPTSPVVTQNEEVAGSGASDGTEPLAPSTTVGATTTIATVPDTGVPGLSSSDRFCQAWSEFAGSFQAVAVASSFASDPATAQRAEVAAAPVIVAATTAIGDELPAELVGERETLVEGLLGPLRRRAERTIVALGEAGVTEEQLAELSTAWLQALAVTGTDDPDIDVSVSDELSVLLDDVAARLAAEAPPISEDPSLITDVVVPQTEMYLVENCPDRGTLAGNDVIDG